MQLREPLKSVGDYTVGIKLHKEVTAHIKVKVVADAVEAEAAAEPAAQEAAAE